MYGAREDAAVLLAAKHLQRPVKWIEDRRENLIAANSARHDEATMTMALDAEGHILAATVDQLSGAGAFQVGMPLAGGGGFTAMLFTGPYRIPLLSVGGSQVLTNTTGQAAYRGPWAIETIAREQMIDAVAHEIGMDPLELRRRNVIHQSDLPYTMASGLVYDVITPEETMEQAASILDWDAFRAEQAAALAEGRYLGAGLSVCIEPSAVGMGKWATEAATVRIDVAGRVEVMMGSGSHGQSLETTIPQIVADHLGCALEDVVLRQGGDTPFGPGTGGSRSAVILGGAAQTASTILRDKVVSIAAHLLEASPDDLEATDSKISVRGNPTSSVSFADVAAAAYLNSAELPTGIEAGLETTYRFTPPAPFTWSNASHLCVAEVDATTGMIELRRFIVSEDCGVMINPMVVEGQIAGGVVQGIGNALYEEMVYDDEGNPLASTFLDYLLPTAGEVPDMEFAHIETRSNTLGGYKGMGEGGAIASPAAVANAVNDALRPLGARIEQFPITPDRVLAAIEAARASGAAREG
jgi:carbon-monoxide dehydrogenase large subunit